MSKTTLENAYLPIADRLPPAPRILPKLLRLLSDPQSELSEIVDLVSFDPGLTSKLLRACNNAFAGASEPVPDIGQAVHRLGWDAVYRLVAAACCSAVYPATSSSSAASALWQNSVVSAFAAELMASDLGLDRGSLFTAALLHDIGQMILAEHWRERYWQLVSDSRSIPDQLRRSERERFELDHGELGGRVLAHWNFPSPIVSGVWQHTNPTRGVPFERESACIALAESIALSSGEGAVARATMSDDPGREIALDLVGLTAEDLGRYLERTQENLQFVNALCQIGL